MFPFRGNFSLVDRTHRASLSYRAQSRDGIVEWVPLDVLICLGPLFSIPASLNRFRPLLSKENVKFSTVKAFILLFVTSTNNVKGYGLVYKLLGNQK